MLNCVDDLHWALASPSLLKVEESTYRTMDDPWFIHQAELFNPYIKKLKENPAPLEAHLSHLKTYRLGAYFEQLIRFWLDHNDRYECVEQNLVIRDKSHTLGEFDFIVFDHVNRCFCHWEMALKFYLGVGDISNLENWHGPNKKDRLDLKHRHLCDKQISLSTKLAADSYLKKKGITIQERRIWIKGRLFYPIHQLNQNLVTERAADKTISPNHLKGGWLSKTELLNELSLSNNRECNETNISVLDKKNWLMNKSNTKLSNTGFFSLVSDLKKPIQVEISNLKTEHSEPKRFFVVPDDWSTF